MGAVLNNLAEFLTGRKGFIAFTLDFAAMAADTFLSILKQVVVAHNTSPHQTVAEKRRTRKAVNHHSSFILASLPFRVVPLHLNVFADFLEYKIPVQRLCSLSIGGRLAGYFRNISSNGVNSSRYLICINMATFLMRHKDSFCLF
jgi:hypothetical protein